MNFGGAARVEGGGRGFLTVTEFEDSVSLHHVVCLTADVAAAPIIY